MKTALITGVTGQDGAYLSEFLVDPKYFRPAEVDILLGDASKARIILGWIPEYDISQLVKEMMQSDLNLMQKELYLKSMVSIRSIIMNR